MSDNITLTCLVHGDPTDRIFEVKIDKNESIYSLKEKIKNKKSNLLSKTDANDITLWKVNIPLSEDRMELDIDLKENAKENIQKILFMKKKIGVVFTEDITDNSIYIIVERPSGK